MDVPKNKLGLQGEEMLEVVDFKCDPILIGTLREEPGFFPAYHMSKDSWITVALDVQRIRWQNQNVAWYELWSNDTQNMQKEILINSRLPPKNIHERGVTIMKENNWNVAFFR